MVCMDGWMDGYMEGYIDDPVQSPDVLIFKTLSRFVKLNSYFMFSVKTKFR